MTEKIEISKALELCGFLTGDRQESRLINLLNVILKLQKDSPIPLTFATIYNQLQEDEPQSKLTKAWVHRVLKSLVEAQLVRVENPSAHRKQYIADVNTVMAGLEQLKSGRIQLLETQKNEVEQTLVEVTQLDCGVLVQQFVKNVTGTQQKISSRVVHGVEALHRVLKFNMLDVAKKGDIVRATVLWMGPFVDSDTLDRSRKFVEAAERGAEVRYLITMDFFDLEEKAERVFNIKDALVLMAQVRELIKKGAKFDIRIFDGQKTYNQVSLNKENMALVIAEDPVTATWVTRDFNPDLIDNAVKAFDRDWKKAKSFLEMSPEDMASFGVEPGGLISSLAKEGRG